MHYIVEDAMDAEGIFEAAILSISITLKNLATQIKLQKVNVVHFTLRGHFISYTCTIYNYIQQLYLLQS